MPQELLVDRMYRTMTPTSQHSSEVFRPHRRLGCNYLPNYNIKAPFKCLSDDEASDSDSDSNSSYSETIRSYPLKSSSTTALVGRRPRPRLWIDNPSATGINSKEGRTARNSCKRKRRVPISRQPTKISRVLRSSLLDSTYNTVTFSDPIITAVWTRPRTDLQAIEMLFYSREDEAKFRREYRRERTLARLKTQKDSSDSDTESSVDDMGKHHLSKLRKEGGRRHIRNVLMDVPHEVTDSSTEESHSEEDDDSTDAFDEDNSNP